MIKVFYSVLLSWFISFVIMANLIYATDSFSFLPSVVPPNLNIPDGAYIGFSDLINLLTSDATYENFLSDSNFSMFADGCNWMRNAGTWVSKTLVADTLSQFISLATTSFGEGDIGSVFLVLVSLFTGIIVIVFILGIVGAVLLFLIYGIMIAVLYLMYVIAIFYTIMSFLLGYHYSMLPPNPYTGALHLHIV